jgi:hypothetical protein
VQVHSTHSLPPVQDSTPLSVGEALGFYNRMQVTGQLRWPVGVVALGDATNRLVVHTCRSLEVWDIGQRKLECTAPIGSSSSSTLTLLAFFDF